MSQQTVRRGMRWVAAIGIFLWLLPNLQYTSTQNGSQMRIELGWPAPPWFHFDRRYFQEGNRATRSVNWKFEFLSWSWVAGFIGCAAGWGARRLRTGEQADANRPVEPESTSPSG